MEELAIIIPAFRGLHLHRALSSLRLQKDRHFRVYVCDDASPDEIASVAAEFEDTLDLTYCRFEENYGATRPSAHLQRCLDQTRGEGLVCFFSDNNEWTVDAVRQIRRAAERRTEVDVFHLNTVFIDEASVRTGDGRRFGRRLDARKLFRRIFVKGAPAPMSSFVFRRPALDRAMFQIKDIFRSPLTLVFAAIGIEGELFTVRRARLLKRAGESMTLEKALQLQSFFFWSEYFFGESYPLSPRDRVELFAARAADMYPALSEEEIREKFLQFRVFEREMGKGRGKRILHRALFK